MSPISPSTLTLELPCDPDPPSADPTRLDQHHDDFRQLLAAIRRHLTRGRFGTAAAYAQVAGQFAWMNHTGLFASPELEAMLFELSARVPEHRSARFRSKEGAAGDPCTVLHVITQAYGTGGSTQTVKCWVDRDRGRRHRICITRQARSPLPEGLGARLASPSDLLRLDGSAGDLLARAAALRAIAAECDVVVLHVHPYDVVPVLAFAGRAGRPPAIYVNHADHVFWLGTGITDVLMNMRESGRDLAIARRGIEPARCIIRNRPLITHGRTLSRDEAKRQLGLDPDRIVLVTAADGTKYRPIRRPGFLDLVRPALERHPEAILIAAGPSATDEWLDAERETGGRVRALGLLPDVSVLQQAADVYLDSFPFSSLTSLLEAGSFETPAVTYRGHSEDCLVLGADTPGIDEVMLAPGNPAEFREVVERAITDPAWRLNNGRRMAEAIRETHTGPGWAATIASMYALAAETDRSPSGGAASRETDELDHLVDAVMMRTGHSTGWPGALHENLGLLPPAARLAAAWRLARNGRRPAPRDLLPEWIQSHLGRLARRIRSLASARR
jgi:glycosyltransferase involved in cell wall biosynthesis